MAHYYTARLVVICTGRSIHKRTLLDEVLLNPILDGVGLVSGVVTTAGRQQQANAVPPRHLAIGALGRRERGRFECPRCHRAVIWNDGTLQGRLLAVADAAGRGVLREPTLEVDVSHLS